MKTSSRINLAYFVSSYTQAEGKESILEMNPQMMMNDLGIVMILILKFLDEVNGKREVMDTKKTEEKVEKKEKKDFQSQGKIIEHSI